MRSRVAEDGSRPSIGLAGAAAPSAPRRSCHPRSKYSTDAAPLTISTLEDSATVVTWIHFQYEFTAGTTGAAGTYSTVPATNSRMTTGSITNRPMVRAPVLASTTSQQSTADAQMTEVNSYMLPSGNRLVASPLARMESTLAARPIAVTSTAARPNRSPQGVARRGASAPMGPR